MRGPFERRHGWLPAAAVIIVVAAGLVPVAQAPQTASPPQTTASPQRGAEPARGGGGGRAGGPDVLPGGPQLDDAAYAAVDFSRKAPVAALTPEQQLARFILQPGYRLELVLSDPDIQEPTAINFDGNGRMFVLENRGYMQDLDATGEHDPIGRISLHTDTDGDGVYDKHSVFADKLVFPRFMMPFGPNAILAKESHAQEVWKLTDTNGDGVADKKELFDTGYGRLANVEHEEAFLTYGLDNWMYSTVNAFRARWTPHGVIKEPTGSNGAQWGVTQDDDGKMWFQGGASGLPSYWQFPIVYGNFGGGRGSGQIDPEMGFAWGAPVRVADMQGGLRATRMPDGSLRTVTGAAGNDIVRAHRMPKDLQGDLLYGEPVGRIVRRVRPENREGVTFLRNYYDANEFIKSTDPYFRPVDMTTAPDGTIYITDLYHGIIQEAQWTPAGSYLRARIQQYGLDKVIHKGRIWRLVYDGVKFDRSDALARDKTVPRMNDETPAQLLTHLGHPNGWWRDTAQRLLVLKQDKSVVPALRQTLNASTNLVERFHALWTLEGLGSLDAAGVRKLMTDPEPRMRIQAVRASETLYKAGDKSFAADYKRLAVDPNTDVVVQALLTINKWKVADAAAVIKATADANKAGGVQLVATTIFNPPAAGGGPGGRGAPSYSAAERAVIDSGGQAYKEICSVCHGEDGFGVPKLGEGAGVTMAPRLAGSPRVNAHRDYVIKATLHGLTGPLDGTTYGDLMVPMANQTDDWIASVLSYVRTSFGNTGGLVTAADVKGVRAATMARKAPWSVAELEASVPRLLVPDATTWKATASHNAGAAVSAFSLRPWTSIVPQERGMWFQVELPQPATITEIQFVSTGGGGRGGGGGGGGRGAAGRGAAAPPEGGTPAAAQTAPAPPAPSPGYPRGYKIETSMNGTTWFPVAEGAGQGATTIVSFKPVQARFVRLTQTALADNAPPLSIQQLRLFEAGAPSRR
jgi:mono/diheme cytochrome c family protein/glucose/arabinose dehydrogenase